MMYRYLVSSKQQQLKSLRDVIPTLFSGMSANFSHVELAILLQDSWADQKNYLFSKDFTWKRSKWSNHDPWMKLWRDFKALPNKVHYFCIISFNISLYYYSINIILLYSYQIYIWRVFFQNTLILVLRSIPWGYWATGWPGFGCIQHVHCVFFTWTNVHTLTWSACEKTQCMCMV